MKKIIIVILGLIIVSTTVLVGASAAPVEPIKESTEVRNPAEVGSGEDSFTLETGETYNYTYVTTDDVTQQNFKVVTSGDEEVIAITDLAIDVDGTIVETQITHYDDPSTYGYSGSVAYEEIEQAALEDFMDDGVEDEPSQYEIDKATNPDLVK